MTINPISFFLSFLLRMCNGLLAPTPRTFHYQQKRSGNLPCVSSVCTGRLQYATDGSMATQSHIHASIKARMIYSLYRKTHIHV
ncbi:hypothetical protein F5Y09DRAFT_281208 [Xylaria sp. FL1042]|nr:hypothetical protein F5Y09DRAFT_281208 [Xylaria sp. FL1042]